MRSFCVIGSGIIGLSSALCIARRFYGCRITIVYEKESPETTSDHSFGICSYHTRIETDGPDLEKWGKVTRKHCSELVRKHADEYETGVFPMSCYVVYRNEKEAVTAEPSLDCWVNSRKATKEEIESFKWKIEDLSCVFEEPVTTLNDLSIHIGESFVVDTAYYLPWIIRELKEMEKRGKITQLRLLKKRIDNFSDVLRSGDKYDCIINCSGMGSSYLVPDQRMVPIRGQYLIMEPKGQIRSIFAGHTFLCEKLGRVSVGSVYQMGRSDNALDPNDTKDILRRSAIIYPESSNWHIIKEDVGIRPGRFGGARVEVEFRTLLTSNPPIPIVHNYGHGSKGVIQHWGCAMDAAALVESVFKNKSNL